MQREGISQIIAVAGSLAVTLGAGLYAVASPHRGLTLGLLAGGAGVLALYGILNARQIAAFFTRRSSRYGMNSLLMVLAVMCLVVIVQALSARHSVRFDVTRNKRFSLAGQTTSVLDSLRKNVGVYAFFKKGTPEEARAEDLVGRFAHRTVRLHYEIIDPDARPQKAKELGVSSSGTTVIRAGDRTEVIHTLNEETLLNAVVRATKNEVKPVCFVYGHGERDPRSDKPLGFSIAAEAVEKKSYEVRTLSLFDEPSVPEDCAVLVVAGPKKDYLQSEIQKISDYLRRGRNALFLIDPQTEVPNIAALLAGYCVRLNDDAVVDPYSRVFGGDYSVPVATQYGSHPITRGFDLATFYPSARSISVSEEPVEGAAAQPLAKTGKSAWGETDLTLIDKGQAVKSDLDNHGPLTIAVVAEKMQDGAGPGKEATEKSEIVVFGDSDFADNSSFGLAGNADFFLNVINYLAEEKDLIAVRPKRGLGDRVFLTASQGRFVFLVCVVLLPLSVVAFGTSVWVKRRRQG